MLIDSHKCPFKKHGILETTPLDPGPWVKGANGQTCNEVCQTIGKVCNSGMQSSLNTNDKVKEAFKQAGYTCKSFHGK